MNLDTSQSTTTEVVGGMGWLPRTDTNISTPAACSSACVLPKPTENEWSVEMRLYSVLLDHTYVNPTPKHMKMLLGIDAKSPNLFDEQQSQQRQQQNTDSFQMLNTNKIFNSNSNNITGVNTCSRRATTNCNNSRIGRDCGLEAQTAGWSLEPTDENHRDTGLTSTLLDLNRKVSHALQDEDAQSAISSASRNTSADIDPGEETETAPEGDAEDDTITRCICLMNHNDDYMICCDKCFVWQHVDCMGISRKNIPDIYYCEKCYARPVDQLRARRIQSNKNIVIGPMTENITTGDGIITRRIGHAPPHDIRVVLCAERTAAAAAAPTSTNENTVVRVVNNITAPDVSAEAPTTSLPESPIMKTTTNVLPLGTLAQKATTATVERGRGHSRRARQTGGSVRGRGRGAATTTTTTLLEEDMSGGGGSDSTMESGITPTRAVRGARRYPSRRSNKAQQKDALKIEHALNDNDAETGNLGYALGGWSENFAYANVNHYSPELRARLNAILKQSDAVTRLLLLKNDLLCQFSGTLQNKAAVVPHAGGKILVSQENLCPNQPVLELRGKFMLNTQFRMQNPNIFMNSPPPSTQTAAFKANRRTPGPFVFFLQILPANEDNNGLDLEICIDTRTYGNEARYARRSCRPNAKLQFNWDNGCLRAYIVAMQNIRASTEIAIAHEPHDILALQTRKSTNILIIPTSMPCACGLRRDCIFAPMMAARVVANTVSPMASKIVQKVKTAQEMCATNDGTTQNVDATQISPTTPANNTDAAQLMLMAVNRSNNNNSNFTTPLSIAANVTASPSMILEQFQQERHWHKMQQQKHNSLQQLQPTVIQSPEISSVTELPSNQYAGTLVPYEQCRQLQIQQEQQISTTLSVNNVVNDKDSSYIESENDELKENRNKFGVVRGRAQRTGARGRSGTTRANTARGGKRATRKNAKLTVMYNDLGAAGQEGGSAKQGGDRESRKLEAMLRRFQMIDKDFEDKHLKMVRSGQISLAEAREIFKAENMTPTSDYWEAMRKAELKYLESAKKAAAAKSKANTEKKPLFGGRKPTRKRRAASTKSQRRNVGKRKQRQKSQSPYEPMAMAMSMDENKNNINDYKYEAKVETKLMFYEAKRENELEKEINHNMMGNIEKTDLTANNSAYVPTMQVDEVQVKKDEKPFLNLSAACLFVDAVVRSTEALQKSNATPVTPESPIKPVEKTATENLHAQSTTKCLKTKKVLMSNWFNEERAEAAAAAALKTDAATTAVANSDCNIAEPNKDYATDKLNSDNEMKNIIFDNFNVNHENLQLNRTLDAVQSPQNFNNQTYYTEYNVPQLIESNNQKITSVVEGSDTNQNQNFTTTVNYLNMLPTTMSAAATKQASLTAVTMPIITQNFHTTTATTPAAVYPCPAPTAPANMIMNTSPEKQKPKTVPLNIERAINLAKLAPVWTGLNMAKPGPRAHIMRRNTITEEPQNLSLKFDWSSYQQQHFVQPQERNQQKVVEESNELLTPAASTQNFNEQIPLPCPPMAHRSPFLLPVSAPLIAKPKCQKVDNTPLDNPLPIVGLKVRRNTIMDTPLDKTQSAKKRWLIKSQNDLQSNIYMPPKHLATAVSTPIVDEAMNNLPTETSAGGTMLYNSFCNSTVAENLTYTSAESKNVCASDLSQTPIPIQEFSTCNQSLEKLANSALGAEYQPTESVAHGNEQTNVLNETTSLSYTSSYNADDDATTSAAATLLMMHASAVNNFEMSSKLTNNEQTVIQTTNNQNIEISNNNVPISTDTTTSETFTNAIAAPLKKRRLVIEETNISTNDVKNNNNINEFSIPSKCSLDIPSALNKARAYASNYASNKTIENKIVEKLEDTEKIYTLVEPEEPFVKKVEEHIKVENICGDKSPKVEHFEQEDTDVDILRTPSPGPRIEAEVNLVKIEPEDTNCTEDVKIDVECLALPQNATESIKKSEPISVKHKIERRPMTITINTTTNTIVPSTAPSSPIGKVRPLSTYKKKKQDHDDDHVDANEDNLLAAVEYEKLKDEKIKKEKKDKEKHNKDFEKEKKLKLKSEKDKEKKDKKDREKREKKKEMKCLLEQQKSLELAINKGKNERERRAKSADPASDSSRPSTPKTGEHYAISLLFGPEDDPRRTVITVRTLKKRDKNNKQLLDKSQKEQEAAEGQKEEAAVAAAVAVLEGPSTSRAAAQAHAMLDTPTKQGENHEEKAHTKDAKNASLPTPIEIFAAPTKKAARTKYRNHSEIQRRNTVCIDTVTKIKDDGFTSIFDKSDITSPTKHCKESISTQSDSINSLNSTLPDASLTKLSDPTSISNPLQAAKSAAKMKAKFRTMELAAAAQEKLQKQAKLLEERNQSRLSAMKKSAIQEDIQRTSEMKIDTQKPVIKEELPTIAKTHETERKEKQRELMRLERERLEKQRRLISDAKIKKENEIVIPPLVETKLVKSNETKFSVEGKKEKRKSKSNSFSDGCEKKRRPAGEKDTLEIENTIDASATEVKNENLPKEREENRPKIGTKTSPIKKQTEIKDAIKQENELSGLPTKELKEICHTVKNEKETTNSAQKSVKEKGKPGLKPRKLSAVDHGVETSDEIDKVKTYQKNDNKNIRKRSYESHDSEVNTPPKKKKDTTENYCSNNKMTQNETKSELYKRKCEYNKDDHVKEREIGKDRKERERDREEKDPRGKERSKQRNDEREQKKDRPSFQNISFTKKRRTSFDNDKNFKYSPYNSRNNTRDAWETSRDDRRGKSRVVDTRNSRPPYRPSVDSRNGSHMRNMPHRQTIDSRLPVNNVAPNWRNRRDSIDVRYNNNSNNRRDSVRENISERPPFNRDYRPRFLPDSVHFNGPTPPIPPMARRESISVPYAHHKRHQQGSNTFVVPFSGTMLPTQQNRYQSLIDQRNIRAPAAKVLPTPNPMEETQPLNKDSTETFLAPHLPARFRAETPITETFPYSSLPTFNNSIYVPASGSIPGNNVVGRPATLSNKGNINISPFKNLFSQSPQTASTPTTTTNLNSTVFGSVVSLQSTVEPSKTLPIKNSINELLTRLKNKDNRSLTNIYENKQIVQWGANTDPRLTRSGSPVLAEIGDKNNSSFESVKNESMETDRKTKKVSLKEYRQRHKSFVSNNESPAPFDNDTVKVRNFQDFIETEKVASACSSYSPHSPTPERVILPTENDVFTVNLTDVKNNYESDNNLNENLSTPRITENSEISVEKLQSDPYTSLFGMKAFSDKPTELEKAQENMSHRFISSRLAFKSPTSEHNIIAGGESSCSNKNDKSSTTPTFSQMLDDVSSGSSDSNMIVTEMTNLDAIKESVAQEDTKSQEKTAKRGNSEQKNNKKMDKKIKERKNADDKLKKDNQLKIKMGDLQMNTSDKDKTKSRATKEKMTDEEKRLQAKMALMAAAALTTSAMSDREA